jgi:proline-specific peptidase
MSELNWTQHGYITVQDQHTWYGSIGTPHPTTIPLLVISGGPGLPHDGYEPLASFAENGRQIIFYDQLGCGNSDRPTDRTVYTAQVFVEEVIALRHALGLERVHVYAHSYGGVIALNYALTQPHGLASLILADTFPSVPALVRGWYTLLATMPPEVHAVIQAYQEHGTPDPRYADYFQTYFVNRYVIRVPMTDSFNRMFQKMGTEVYEVMHGPAWFKATGTYGTWDVTDRLHEITVPTLVFCGRDDQCIPSLSATLHHGIPHARLHIFEQCAHLPYLEQPEEHQRLVETFLAAVEA